MLKHAHHPLRDNYIHTFEKNLYRIIILASLVISLAVAITGIINYTSTRNALITKSKSEDMIFILKSMSEKVEGRIQRAEETSFLIARDPMILEWLNGLEQDPNLREDVLKKLNDIAVSYDYSNTFLVSAKTKHYYFKLNKPNDNLEKSYTLSESNSADQWFFQVIKSREPISLNVNYDRGMGDTFLFINTLMGDPENPVGVSGVGLSLGDIAKEFQQEKVGNSSSLWMIDAKGEIQLSDRLDNRGKNISELIPEEVVNRLKSSLNNPKSNPEVAEYTNNDGQLMDYAFYKVSNSNLILYYQIPRKDNISIINSLKTNTLISVFIVLIFFVILFFIASRKIANPYKQTVMLNQELEKKVTERTQELVDINRKVMDSIDYAQRMQESILPSSQEMRSAFSEYFVMWSPRDGVGGDFYWLKKMKDSIVLAVGDCTGHGVPGALMTMTVNAILHNVVNDINSDNPAVILKELDRQVKEAMNKNSNSKIQAVDDGLDLAICCIKNKSEIVYAGAKIDLQIKRKNELKVFKGYKKGIGYSNSELQDDFTGEKIQVEDGDIFILTSDGFIHQNGGDQDYPFGTKRFYQLIQDCESTSLDKMNFEFENALRKYMKDEPQRDDIVLLAFRIK